MTVRPEGERLARIEALLEVSNARLKNVEACMEEMKREQQADKADLAALKNKGAGVMLGIALAAGGLGATAATFWSWIIGVVK